MAPKVTVVVAQRWPGHLLEDALDALAAQARPGLRVLVVLEAEAADELAALDSPPPWTRHRTQPEVLRLPAGRSGRAAAWNLGLRTSHDADYLALLRRDAVPDPGWLDNLLRALEQRPSFGYADCPVRLLYSPDLLDSAGLALSRSGTPLRRGHRARGSRRWDHTCELLAARSVGCLYRVSMLHELGGFDEELGDHHEDLDLGWRAFHRGHRGVYEPGPGVRYRGDVGPLKSAPAFAAALRSQEWVMIKNADAGSLVRMLPWMLGNRLATGLEALRRGRGRVWLSAEWQALRALPAWWRRRQTEQVHAGSGPRPLWQALAPSRWLAPPFSAEGREQPGDDFEFGAVLQDRELG